MLRLRCSVLLFVFVAVFVTVGACGDDDANGPTTTPSAPPQPRAFAGGRNPVTATPVPGLTAALLQDVRIASQRTFDSITFEFDGGGLPGYDVRYVKPPILYDPRGDEMGIDGEAFIVVRIQPAAGHDPETGSETYTGPLELKPGLPALLEAERIGDFEGVLRWALGLSTEADFRVEVLEDSPRLVIDIAY